MKYLLALLFPPSSVFLDRGVGMTLMINIVLTIVGVVPGVAHALWIVAQNDR